MTKTPGPRPLFLAAALSAAFLALAGCKSDEQQAEDHYEKGVTLLAQGDNPRAYVEFRNALKEVPAHRPTLQAFAAALEKEGRLSQAYGMRKQLAELEPDNAAILLAAAMDGIELGDWDRVSGYREKITALAPEDPRSKLVALALDYQDLTGDKDSKVVPDKAITERAAALAKALPDSDVPHRILLDAALRRGDDRDALSEAEVLIARNPDQPVYYRTRLALLNRLGDETELEAGLKEMIKRFPDEDQAQRNLVALYLRQGNLDAAEAFLRGRVPEGKPDDQARLNLVGFLHDKRGPEAARKALEDFVAEGTNDMLFRGQLAGLDYEAGQRDKAIAEMCDIISAAQTAQGGEGGEGSSGGKGPEAEQLRKLKVTLAGMLNETGDTGGARDLLQEVLAGDSSMVPALQLQAQMQIAADNPDGAVVSLRRALNEEPSESRTLTLLAQAYQRNGDRELSGEALGQAAEATDYAVAESLRYASYLMQDKKWLPAEDVLLNSLRRHPDTPALLAHLAEVYVQLEDWPRAGQIERSMRRLGSDEMLAQADRLHARILAGQQRSADALAFLENAAQGDGATVASQVALLRAHLDNGDAQGARSYLDGLLAQDPQNVIYRLMDPALKNVMGDHAGAEAQYRALAKEMPDRERIWLELYRTLLAEKKPQEAETALDAGLKHLPDGPDLNWAKAGILERDGDIPGAIAIYEKLYAKNSGSSILANNLASLLSASAKGDDDRLNRAWNIARRLRDSDIPAFQDTYGWIAYRRGDMGEALRNLEPAAKGLAQDPMVLFHLGTLYAALPGRQEDATRLLSQAVAVGDKTGTAAGKSAAQQAQAGLEALRSGQ